MPIHLERIRLDAVHACRGLLATPATTFATVALLTVAIGVNLAVFGLIDRAILNPARHVVRPERLFNLAFDVPSRTPSGAAAARMTTTSYVAFDTLREGVPAFASAAAWRRLTQTFAIGGEQVRLEALQVSGHYFTVLGAQPRLGRAILDEDDQPAGAAVVISHELWRTMFAGDPAVLGRVLSANDTQFIVAGVMPAGFTGHSATEVDVWLPLAAAMRNMPGWDSDPFRNIVGIVARIADGADVTASEQATAALGRKVFLVGLGGGEVSAAEQRITYALAGVSILVLAIGLANAATLLLVRGARRQRECAIRSALGATRSRLASAVIVEAFMLGAVVSLGSLALAVWTGDLVSRLVLPRAAPPGLTPELVGLAVAAGIVATAVAVSVGIWQLPRRIEHVDFAAPTTRRRSVAQAGLLIVQTAFSVVLIVGALTFGASLYHLRSQDFGMRLANVVLVDFEPGPSPIDDQREVLLSALVRLRSLPGVDQATTIQALPFAGFHVPPIGVPGMAESPQMNGQLPYLNAATPELFGILGIDIVEGRRFTSADESGAPVVIVNQSMARTIWPGEPALGKCIRIGFDPSFDPFTATGPPGPPTSVPCREVVGVARDVRQRSVVPTGTEDRLMQYFVPFTQVPPPPGAVAAAPGVRGLVLRTAGDPARLISEIRRAVVNGRADLPFVQVRPYWSLLERQMQPWRTGTLLLVIFGVLALAVAAVGQYAVFAHAVAERRREMAIRLAVGAQSGRLLRMILVEASRLAVLGVVGGSILAWVASRGLESMFIGTAPTDPRVLGGAAALMIAVAAAATCLPARRASRVDPTDLLRVE